MSEPPTGAENEDPEQKVVVVIGKSGNRAVSAIGVVLVVCVGVRVAAWLIGPALPILVGIGAIYVVVFGLLRHR